MSRIEVQEDKRDRSWTYRVDPFFDPANKRRGFQARVTVFSDQDYSFEDHGYHWRNAYISWYSVGSASIAEAAAFAKAIEMCVEKAREMDAEHKLTVRTEVKP